jgi:hypothetical protein
LGFKAVNLGVVFVVVMEADGEGEEEDSSWLFIVYGGIYLLFLVENEKSYKIELRTFCNLLLPNLGHLNKFSAWRSCCHWKR